MSVSLRLPFAVAQGLAGRSVPVVFEVTGVVPERRRWRGHIGHPIREVDLLRAALNSTAPLRGCAPCAGQAVRCGFLDGPAVADVVDPLEGRDDLLVVRDDDDGRVELRAIWLRMRITARARSLSSGAVGSSARITGGRFASARAIARAAARRRRAATAAPWRGVRRPAPQQFQRAPARDSAFGRPASIGSRATLSVTSRNGIR
jgi:hypothetical protein